ncbi:glycosyltransferase family 1 protein, partial [Patescibacteria group bacterium]
LPVACSNASCLPEICADAVRYFDPERPADIARTLGELADSPESRAELVRRGYDHAKRFDWDDLARRTRELYEISI